MMNVKKFTKKGQGFGRRSFLKWGGASLMLSPLLINAKIAFGKVFNQPKQPKDYWQYTEEGNPYFVQTTVDTSQVDSGYILARVDGWWRRYKIRELENKFCNWWFEFVTKEYTEEEIPRYCVGGARLPIVASCGNRRGRGDSQFSLNAACKGVGFFPKKEYIKDINKDMEERLTDSWEDRRTYLREIQKQRELWDLRRMISIEIFSEPGFETHTFLNQMENPVSTISYMDTTIKLLHFEVRTIVRLLAWYDPNLSEDERDIARFANLLHVIPFKDPPNLRQDMNVPIYHHIEEFDNQPYGPSGRRLVPPFTYE